MTADVTPLPSCVPPYDGLAWSAERLPGGNEANARWAAVGRIPDRSARIEVVTVTTIRAGGSAEDLACQVADFLNGIRNP